MDVVQITTVIGAAASLICTLVVGALTFFVKRTLTDLEKADEQNKAKIEAVEEKLNDLKADLPLVYVTREDYIRGDEPGGGQAGSDPLRRTGERKGGVRPHGNHGRADRAGSE